MINDLLDRSLVQLLETEELASEVRKDLIRQTDDMRRINNKLQSFNGEVDKSKKIIKVMKNRTITNRLIIAISGAAVALGLGGLVAAYTL